MPTRSFDETRFHIVWWQPADAWAEAWRRGAKHDFESSQPPPTTTARLIVRGATGETWDRCDLSFGSYVLVPHPREDGWVIPVTDPLSVKLA